MRYDKLYDTDMMKQQRRRLTMLCLDIIECFDVNDREELLEELRTRHEALKTLGQ